MFGIMVCLLELIILSNDILTRPTLESSSLAGALGEGKRIAPVTRVASTASTRESIKVCEFIMFTLVSRR